MHRFFKGIYKKCLPKKLQGFLYKSKLRLLNKELYDKLNNKDDFEWSEYTKTYTEQLYGVELKENTLILPDGKYSIDGRGKIVLDSSLLPLHPNHKLIYETIYHLKPDSVLEIGFGAGDHLANIQKILPHIKISGCELLESQMKLALLRHPELKSSAHLCLHDITTSHAPHKADLVFTQAVIMHIQKDGRHLNALRNIFHASKKYVLLMENYGRHNFYDDIRKISKEPNFPW